VTISALDLLLYAGALVILFFTPGPVWMALMARALSGGFRSAWPLAFGVAIGDALWPLLAILGVSWVASTIGGFMVMLRILASVIFLAMGFLLIHRSDRGVATDSRLTRPGRLAGFVAGVAVILGNPKAILFYMGVLPGFFDLSGVRTSDVVAIVAISIAVPLIGNLCFALFIGRARRVFASPKALRRTHIIAGLFLIGVGLVIPFV